MPEIEAMATSDEKVEEAIGIINGINVDFSASLSYQSGTLFVFENGFLLPTDDDRGLVEDSPAAGTFHMKVAPKTDDEILVRYIEG